MTNRDNEIRDRRTNLYIRAVLLTSPHLLTLHIEGSMHRKHRQTLTSRRLMASVCHKLVGGPGGWYCTCCNPLMVSPRRMKPLARRLFRRRLRQLDRNQMADGEYMIDRC
jgi:hypothetical protein